MGTWATGPFGNDAALDHVGDVVSELSAELDDFLREPRIDEGFDEAFATVAILNLLAVTPAGPPPLEQIAAWRTGLLGCYDAQIDELQPDDAFKVGQRAALVQELDALESRARAFWRAG